MRVVSGCYTATLYSGAVNCESTQIQSLMHTNVQYNEAASRSLVNRTSGTARRPIMGLRAGTRYTYNASKKYTSVYSVHLYR